MKKCYLHIGNFKTGTTSLQAFFYLNKKIFKNFNFQFIEEKNFFKETVHNQNLFKLFDKKEFKKIRKYFLIKKAKSNLILSSEFFSCFSYNLEKIEYLKKTILKLGYKPIIIFYYRSDYSYLYSLYVQQLTQKKNIEIESVFEFCRKVKKFHYYRNKKNRLYFMSQNYNLNNLRIITNWRKIFKKDFFVLKFDKKNNDKIFYDFLKIIKINSLSKFSLPLKKNVSRKLKPWNLKRIFYFYFLGYMQKKIFKKNELNVEIKKKGQ